MELEAALGIGGFGYPVSCHFWCSVYDGSVCYVGYGDCQCSQEAVLLTAWSLQSDWHQ